MWDSGAKFCNFSKLGTNILVLICMMTTSVTSFSPSRAGPSHLQEESGATPMSTLIALA